MARTRSLKALAALLMMGATPLVSPLATAGAQTPVNTDVTVALDGGLLSIGAPATATGSGSVSAGGVVNVAFADTTVSDARGSLLGWTVTGSATDLTTGAGGTGRTIPKGAMTWTTGAITTVAGSSSGVAGATASMGLPWVAAAAVPTAGAGTYAYPATVGVVVPPGLYAGSYTGTVTQSVA